MLSVQHIFAIVRKELTQLRRDRATLAMVVMIPLIQLILFGYAIRTTIRDIPAGIVDQSHSSLSRALAQDVAASGVVSFTHHYASVAAANAALVSAEVRAVLIIPADFSQRLISNPNLGIARSGMQSSALSSQHPSSRPLAQWIVDGSDTTIAAAIKGLRMLPLSNLLGSPNGNLNTPTPTFEMAFYFNPEQRSAVNVVPGLVGIILTMTMIMFTAAAIVRERERGNLEMLINTPIRPLELMLGKIIPFIFIGSIQVTIILGLGHFILGVPINGSLLQIALVSFLFIAASLSLGLVISTIARNQLQAMQMTIFVLLPSILLSGFLFPYESMPVPAQQVAKLFPATYFMRCIRGAVLRNATVIDMAPDILCLLAFTIITLSIASLRFKKRID